MEQNVEYWKKQSQYWEREAEWFEKKAIERSHDISWKAFQLACQRLEELDELYANEVGDSTFQTAGEFQKEILDELMSKQKKSTH